MKRLKNKVDGWVVLDKPLGMGSTTAVGRVRWLFGAAKAGHGGTLDPLATGILPIALGEATKTVPFVMDGRKEYRFTLCFGEARSTEDAEGEVTATSAARPTDQAIRAALPAFVGEIDQMPPAFSALKIDGQRAYDLARGRAEGPSTSRCARSPSSGWSCWTVPTRTMQISWLGAEKAPISGPWAVIWRWPWGPSDTCRPCVGRSPVHFVKRGPFRFPNWRPSGIFRRFSGLWLPLRPRWTTSRRWP